MSVSLAQTAEALASAGYHVFPLEVRGKRPLTALARHGKDDATNNVETVRGWWQAVPNANIGIATAPSGIVVLDVDVAGEKPGMASLKALQIEHGLPRTLTARTGRGGIHYVYARPAGEAPHTRLSFRPGLDLIGNGYIVAAPSVLEDGGQYTWLDAKEPIVALPAPLVEVMRGRGSSTSTPAATVLGDGTAGIEHREAHAAVLELAASWPTSGRHEAQLALAGALAQEGWQPEEIAAFAAAVARYELGREPGYDGEPAKRLAAARASVVKVEACEEVAGWGKLVQRLGARGQEVVDGVRRRLRVGQGTVDTMQSIVQAGGGSLTPAGAAAAPWETGAAPSQADDGFVDIGYYAHVKPPPVITLSTGFPALDEQLRGGIRTRSMALVYAPPGSFKTALLLDILRHMSEQGHPALYVGAELEGAEVMTRFGAQVLDEEVNDPDAANAVAWSDVQDPDSQEYARLGEACQGADVSVLCVDRAAVFDAPDPMTAVLKSLFMRLDRLRAEGRVEGAVVGIDYLQLLVREGDAHEVRSRLALLSKKLIQLAREFNVAILALSSVNRENYGGARAQVTRASRNAAAYMAAGKESGDLEFDAAVVAYLDVDHVNRAPDGCLNAIVNIAKARRGRAGQVGFKIRAAAGRWIPDPDAVDRVIDADAERKDNKKSMREIAKVGKREAEAASAAVVAHEGPPKPNTPKHDPAQVARDVQLRRDVLDLITKWDAAIADPGGAYQEGFTRAEIQDKLHVGYGRGAPVIAQLLAEGLVVPVSVRRVDGLMRRRNVQVLRLAQRAPAESPAPVIAPGGEVFARFAGVDKVREETGPPLTAPPGEADHVVRGYAGP